MATPFSYPNNITAGTPAVAAEVQDNFDDLLDWIDSYYQQTADTTAEIAAAIAANGGPVAFAECSAAVATGSITLDTKFAIPGLTATWTADPTHIYRIDVEQIAWLFSAGTTSHRHAVIVSDSASGFTGYTVWQVESDSATTGGEFWNGGGSCFLTGESGSVTWTAYGVVRDGASHGASLFQSGQMLVTDLGVAP